MKGKLFRAIIYILFVSLIISTTYIPLGYASSSPKLDIISPKNGDIFTMGSTIRLVATVEDADSGTLTYFLATDKKLIESGPVHTGTLTKEIKINTPGEHTISLTVIDENNNYATGEVAITILNTPPTVEILQPKSGFTTTATATKVIAHIKDMDSSTLTWKGMVNGTVIDTGTTASDATVSFTAPLNTGTNTILVEVSDGYTSTAATISIKSVPVIASLIWPKDGDSVISGTITIQGKVEARSEAEYTIAIDGNLIKKGTITNATVSASVFVETGGHTITITATCCGESASDTIHIVAIQKPQIKAYFPRHIESGIATLTINTEIELKDVIIYSDGIKAAFLPEIETGTTNIKVQTELILGTATHTISIQAEGATLFTSTFSASGSMPFIEDLLLPATTTEPSVYIEPLVSGASQTLIYAGDTLLGIPPLTFSPGEDGTYTIWVNAKGGDSFSVWKNATITFIWAPMLSLNDIYWEEGKLHLSIEITDYDKDTDMLTIEPIKLYYPITMNATTETVSVEIPESYISVGSTLTIIAHDMSDLTSSLTFTVPGKIPPPKVIAPNPDEGATVFSDTVQVTVEVSATGTIYWYEDGYLTKKQPAPQPGRYTYTFFVPDIKRYEIYAKICDGVSCSPPSDTVIIKKGSFIKLWIGRNMYFNNGSLERMDVAPFIDPRYGRTVVPIRFVGQALGYDIGWNPKTRDVTLSKGEITIVMNMVIQNKVTLNIEGQKKTIYVGSSTVTITENGMVRTINLHNYNGQDMGEPVIVDSRTYVPIRFLSEILGAKVTWDGKRREIGILFIP